MNDRFGEGKWPVVASYDNIYALSHSILRSVERMPWKYLDSLSLSPSLPLPLYQNNRVFSIEYTDLLLNLT